MTKKNITIRDVAAHAGVSVATVSRVINNTDPVTAESREKVLNSVEALNYRPNYISKALASNRSFNVGLVVRAFTGFFFGEVMRSLEQTLREGGQQLIVVNGQSNREKELKAVEFLQTRNCDALILYADHLTEDELIELSQSGTPLIIVGRYIAQLKEHCVYYDIAKGSYDATKHLIELGHRDIALVTTSLNPLNPDMMDRIVGYKLALQEANIPFNPELLVDSDYNQEASYIATQRLLDKKIPFTAIFYFNDECAMGGLKKLNRAGFSVPDDISIVGFDNSSISAHLIPGLTSVHSPAENIGLTCGKLALSMIDGKECDLNQKKEAPLIIRESTGPVKQHK